MKVGIVFDRRFEGEPPQAVWLVDRPANRAWFERHRGSVDANSALFDAATPAMNVIWSAQEHHPGWHVLEVTGLPLTPEVAAACAADGAVEPIAGGFRLLRR